LHPQYATKREFYNWLRDERYKAFSELLECVAPFVTREEFNNWPDEIRTISQRVYLLYPGGRPSEDITNSIESLFKLVIERKQGKVNDLSKWKESMRNENRVLREGLAKLIHTA